MQRKVSNQDQGHNTNIPELEYLYSLIAQDELSSAVDSLLSAQNCWEKDISHDLILMSMELHESRGAYLKGLLPWKKYIRQKRQITHRLLMLLDKVYLD